MRFAGAVLIFSLFITPCVAQKTADGPTDEKAKKTYNDAQDYLRHRNLGAALDAFKKADKQDGGHCRDCRRQMIKLGSELQEWKVAEAAAQEEIAEAKGDDLAVAHYDLGMLVMRQALAKNKKELFSRVHDEMTRALEVQPKFPQALFADGRALAHMEQDDAAKGQFEKYVAMRPEGDPQRERALRYIIQPELARARMAPAFAVTTLDGQHVSMDQLKGKVVLVDFWATWCGPCREALPHMKKIAKAFEGQPLVILSISLDRDEQTWKEFIENNGMNWTHYRDGGFEGPIAKMFGVDAIPHTFTIDPEGVLQDERIGDASIEGKLKKLVTQARELEWKEKAAAH
jgi:thiol-disulfide isomerase/thioredoxin